MKTLQAIRKKNTKWWVGTVSLLILFGAIGSFAYSKMKFVIQGVKVQASIETNGTSPLVEVRGSAAHAVYITLNGREIFIDKEGNFSEKVALLPGLGVVTLAAEDKFGKVAEKKFEVVYTEHKSVALLNK